MSKIFLNVTRQKENKRYIFEFDNRIIKWHMYLDDKVIDDPQKFNAWMASMVEDVQLKSK